MRSGCTSSRCEVVNQATEIKLRAERKAGGFLRDTDKAKNQYSAGRGTLPALGITKDQSSQWQKVAAIPDQEFERKIIEAKPWTISQPPPWIIQKVERSFRKLKESSGF